MSKIKITKRLARELEFLGEVIEWLYANRKDLQDAYDIGDYFEFEDYGGMPKRLSRRLSPGLVDSIQFIQCGIGGMDKIRLFEELCHY
jgi:hypothetical protein